MILGYKVGGGGEKQNQAHSVFAEVSRLEDHARAVRLVGLTLQNSMQQRVDHSHVFVE